MSDFKGTKGEWHACCKSNKPHFLFSKEGEVAICGFYQKQDDGSELPLEEVQANARLIESAPDLLEALQHGLRLANLLPNKESIAVKAFVRNAEKAINKALGL